MRHAHLLKYHKYQRGQLLAYMPIAYAHPAPCHAPARQELGDFCPSITKASLCQTNTAILIGGPGIFADRGVQLIFESLSTLLPTTALELRRNYGPLSKPVFLHQGHNEIVFLLRPRPPAAATREHEVSE